MLVSRFVVDDEFSHKHTGVKGYTPRLGVVFTGAAGIVA